MTRKTKVWGSLLLMTSVLATTGCEATSLSSLKPASPKLAIGIVASQEFIGSKEFINYTERLFNQSGVVFDIRPVTAGSNVNEALTGLASNKQVDLLVTEAKYEKSVRELAKTYDDKKISLIGYTQNPVFANIRKVDVDLEQQAFVSGYLMAAANVKEPIGVIVNKPRSLVDSEWKGLLEGIHYAGSSVNPTVMTLEQAMSNDGLRQLKNDMPRVLILLDPVTEDQLARLHASGRWLFSLHDLPKMYPSVIAKPKNVFIEGMQEEIQTLLNNSWQGNQTVTVMGSGFFDILRPDTIAGMMEREKSVTDALRNKTITPESYINPPKPKKK